MTKKNLKWTNWSKSFSSYPTSILYPTSETELVSIVKKANSKNSKIKIIGSGHSCSLIAETNKGTLISLDNYKKIISINKEKNLITVEAGIRLKDLCTYLTQNNVALSNMGTIDEQSIAGAVSTGTHGTGIDFGALDQQIQSMGIIIASGEILTVSDTKNLLIFKAAKVGLGAFGIISSVTLKIENSYNLEVNTQNLSFDEMLKNIHLIRKTDYLRFWWVPHTDKVQLWKANRTKKTSTKTNAFLNWLQGIFKGNIVHEIGLWITSFIPNKIPMLNKFMYHILFKKEIHQIGNSHEEFTLPIHLKQSVMEYGIPLEHTTAAITEIKQLLIKENLKVHMPIELRFTPKNDALLSMAHDTETCYIGIISYKPFGKNIPHDVYFEKVHNIFKKYQGRPHWAKKHFYTSTELKNLYPKWKEFSKIKNELDPNRIFENDFLKKIF